MDTRQPPSMHEAGAGPRTWAAVMRRLMSRVAAAYAAQAELHERVWLRQEPWREELLHWSYDGVEWHLHGTRMPRSGGSRSSVTRSGWCPALGRGTRLLDR